VVLTCIHCFIYCPLHCKPVWPALRCMRSGVTEQFLHVLVFMWNLQCTFKLCTRQLILGFGREFRKLTS